MQRLKRQFWTSKGKSYRYLTEGQIQVNFSFRRLGKAHDFACIKYNQMSQKSPTRTKRSKTIQFISRPMEQEVSELEIYYTDHDLKGSVGKECRICLEGQENGNRLITPCFCTGSVEFAHEQCIRLWIDKLRRKNHSTQPVSCQLCKQIYVYELIEKRECNNLAKLREKIQQNQKIFVLLCFLVLLTLGVSAYLMILFSQILKKNHKSSKSLEIGVISFSILLLIIIVFLLVSMTVRQFAYTRQRVVGNVMSMINRNRKMSHFTDSTLSPQVGSKAKVVPELPPIMDLEDC